MAICEVFEELCAEVGVGTEGYREENAQHCSLTGWDCIGSLFC